MRISIVTINYNDVQGLQNTMESVFRQTYNDIEYIIIDGGSTDGSAELIKSNAGKLAYWVSEKDKGIYNAMNKGIERATGDYIVFINSRDELYSETCLAEAVAASDQCGIVFSDIEMSGDDAIGVVKYPTQLSFKTFYNDFGIAHPGCLIRRDLFEQLGSYDERLKICSDWKWFMVAICKYNVTHKHTNLVMVKYDMTGISSNAHNLKIIEGEKRQILNEEFRLFITDYDRLQDCEQKIKHVDSSRLIKIAKKLGLLESISSTIKP